MSVRPPRRPSLHYRRATFITKLPKEYRYSPSHYWLMDLGDGRWRVGLTRFATRMLGDMVDHGFEKPPGTAIRTGDILGWVEGFKAIADVYAPGEGTFVLSNPALEKDLSLVDEDLYEDGWLFEFEGVPDDRCMDVETYRDLLDRTIDRILASQKDEESAG